MGLLMAAERQFIPRPAQLAITIEGTMVVAIQCENWQARALTRTLRSFQEAMGLSATGLIEALTAIIATEAAAHGEHIGEQNGSDNGPDEG